MEQELREWDDEKLGQLAEVEHELERLAGIEQELGEWGDGELVWLAGVEQELGSDEELEQLAEVEQSLGSGVMGSRGLTSGR